MFMGSRAAPGGHRASGIRLAEFPSRMYELQWSSLNAFVFGIQLKVPAFWSLHRTGEVGFHLVLSALLFLEGGRLPVHRASQEPARNQGRGKRPGARNTVPSAPM